MEYGVWSLIMAWGNIDRSFTEGHYKTTVRARFACFLLSLVRSQTAATFNNNNNNNNNNYYYYYYHRHRHHLLYAGYLYSYF